MPDAIRLAEAVGALDAPPPASHADAPDAAPMELSTPAMRVVRGHYRSAEGARAFTLYLPEGDGPPAGRPLIVMLHGCTQDAADIARGTRLHEFAGEKGWMVLYPEQPESENPRKCWNWYDAAHQGRDHGEPSIIAGMTAHVVAEHRGDARRAYLAGVSAGGAMATLVAAAYPEQYAGLAVHSGLVHGASQTVMEALGVMQRGVPSPEPYAVSAFAMMGPRARIVPTIVFHGESDAVVAPINGAQVARQWFLTNALTMGQPLDTTSGASDRSERIEGGYLTRRSVYRAKDGTPLSTLVTIRELGHAWSGGDPAGSFTDPRGPTASRMIVDFLESLGQS